MSQKEEYWKDIKYRGQSDDAFAKGTHKTKKQMFPSKNPIEGALEKKHNLPRNHEEYNSAGYSHAPRTEQHHKDMNKIVRKQNRDDANHKRIMNVLKRR